MLPLKTFLKAGTIIGEGVRAYTIEKVTPEAVYLRGHPDAQRGDRDSQNGALRIIPAIVLEDIIRGLETNRIQLDDIMRKRGDEKTEDLFSLLGVEHDKFILGYDSTIFKLCELWQKMSKQHPDAVKSELFLEDSLHQFKEQSHADFTQSGLRVPDNLLLRIGASLLAKRFLILTGLSGSGKTKLAHAFASWLTESEEQYRLVAVGADWTTNENVIGYQDALRPEIYRKPSNGLLDVILRAETDASRPYFLILDEMNLSHVERYFADILSAIESSQEIALHAEAVSLKSSDTDTLLVPAKITLPKNLFIIGTVNVDETTYMFSPKVLDRANVIEFRATADDIAAFLDVPSAVDMTLLAGKGAAFGAAFVQQAATEDDLDSATALALKEKLVQVFKALAPIGAEFGFRTAYEISRFVRFHNKLRGAGWQFNEALDAQVLQKLMPKLHGSQRRLEPVLKALETFCIENHCNASLEKIKRMQDRLKDGFTSFAEA
jgi:energy-coupling factor transporter ATP-binding protein EcfA2